MMKRLNELLVTTHNAVTRQHAAGVLVQFLLFAPLTTKRLQQHLDLLLANLKYGAQRLRATYGTCKFDCFRRRYPYEAGREAVLDTLHHLLERFPQQVRCFFACWITFC